MNIKLISTSMSNNIKKTYSLFIIILLISSLIFPLLNCQNYKNNIINDQSFIISEIHLTQAIIHSQKTQSYKEKYVKNYREESISFLCRTIDSKIKEYKKSYCKNDFQYIILKAALTLQKSTST